MTGKRVLILEDTPSIALLLAASLKRKGCLVDIRDTAQGAVDLCVSAANQNSPVDLILADVMLEDGPGYTVPASLTQHGMDIPVLMMSADGSSATRAQCLAAGARCFFEKPFDISDVLAEIKAALYLRRETGGETANDFEQARAELEQSYYIHLADLKQQMAGCLSREQIRSILHQTKGSASLYGLVSLAHTAHGLSEQLKADTTATPQQIKLAFCSALQAALDTRQAE